MCVLIYSRKESTAIPAPVLTKLNNAELHMRKLHVLSVVHVGQQIWKIRRFFYTGGGVFSSPQHPDELQCHLTEGLWVSFLWG